MTRRQRQIVRDTFESVREAAVPVALLFYGRLFERDPSIRPMFQIDLRSQSTKLMGMLDAIVESLDEFEAVRPKLRELGRRHVGYGVRDDQYDTLAAALLWALGQALEHQFDAETRQAWGVLIDDISIEMKKGASSVQ